MAASRDGSLIGAGDGEGMVRVWRASDGQRLWIVGSHNNGVYGVAFNQPNDLFAFSNTQLGKEGYVALLDGPTAAPLPLDSSRRAAFGVSFSSDGTLLASANGDHRVSVWRVQDGAFLRDLVGHTGAVTSVDFASTGSLLASAAADGTARLWNATNGVELRVIAGGGGSWVPVSDRAARVRFSADGKTLLTRSNSTVRFWRVSDGKLLLTYTNVGNGVFAVSPDGKHFAYGTGGPLDTNAAVVLARMPLLITNSAVRTNALNLEWQGGTGLYQIQHTSNVASLVWQDLGGPTSTTTTNVPVSATNTFFRVQSLEPPP